MTKLQKKIKQMNDMGIPPEEVKKFVDRVHYHSDELILVGQPF